MDVMGFWTIAGALTLGVMLLLLLSLRRAGAEAEPAAQRDIAVYRDQLAEVDRDLARGTLPPAEAERLKTEIARRLLAADRALTSAGPATAATSRTPLLLAGALVLAAGGGALAIYSQTGVPWYPDLPLDRRLAEADHLMASRPSQAQAVADLPPAKAPAVSPDYAALMDKLRASVDPATATDPRGLELLARNEGALGNFAAAEAAQRRLIVVKGAAATAEDHAGLAEILIRWAGGYVSPEAEAALVKALELDPRNGTARYFSGLMFAQSGRYDHAFQLWQPLYESSPPEAPWMQPLATQLPDAARLAGIRYDMPSLKGPSAGDMAAAADMTPEDRQAMIEGMVDQLSNRLATEGGSAQEWAQLITALGVLGRKDQAQEIYAEAKQRFASQPDALASLADVATAAGLAP